MAFCRGNEFDSAVAMFLVVPVNKHAYPLPGGKEALKRPARVGWPVFHRLEERL